MSFASLGLPEPVTRGVRAAGYHEPTPIQLQAIPLIVPGRDLIAAAETGSGKTAAFLLPILARLLGRGNALRALVLAPTRELAAQIEESAREYARFTGLRVGAVFGGVPIGPQERMLRNDGIDLLVATPGRLLDLHGRQSLALEDVEVLVLDEADRMVDMGFAPDLRRILKLLPGSRQTLMFSATMPRELNAVAREALSGAHRLEVAPPQRPAPKIAQRFYPVPVHLKVDLLEHVLARASAKRVLVFARTRRGADRLSRELARRGERAAVLHGDRSQGQRERALNDFRRGRASVLIATDIASRGIDVDRVTHVINYDVPRTPEDYVHRIGRTGRMHERGEALTFMSPEERSSALAIERFLGRSVERATVPELVGHGSSPSPDASRRDSARPRERAATHSTRQRPKGTKRPERVSAPELVSSTHRARRAERPPTSRRGAWVVLPNPAAAEPAAHDPGDGTSTHGRRRRINPRDRRSRRRM